MSSTTCSEKFPPVPQYYTCKACNTRANHWIMSCDMLEEYLYSNSTYVVDYGHVNVKVQDFADSINIHDDEKYISNGLVRVFDKLAITQEQLCLWVGYSGGKLFSTKNCARDRLTTVIEFAENDRSCSKHIKQKLRMITKLIIDNDASKYIHILLLLASHGRVCNVMKEVAINNAYGLMTDKLNDFIQSQSLKQQVIKVLRDYRILLVETLFHKFNMTNNTHYIAGFHNELSQKIGVEKYNDPDICSPTSRKCKNWRKGLSERYFKIFYTKNNIIKHIQTQISEQKIKYQSVVQFFQDNCPQDTDRIKFLTQAIDIDTGAIRKEYICWLLQELNVFMMKPKEWKPIEKCWDDISE